MQRIITALGLLAVATLTACSTAATADTPDPAPAAADEAADTAAAETDAADAARPDAAAGTADADATADTAATDAPADTTDTTDATPTSVDATPTPADAPVAAAGTYGSDPELDRLFDECAAGVAQACDALYWESPVDSAYEAFALANGAGPSGSSLLTAVWTSMDAVEQLELCEAVDHLGMDAAYDEFLIGFGGSDGAPTGDEFRDLIVDHC
jgi:hypothetical protein